MLLKGPMSDFPFCGEVRSGFPLRAEGRLDSPFVSEVAQISAFVPRPALDFPFASRPAVESPLCAEARHVAPPKLKKKLLNIRPNFKKHFKAFPETSQTSFKVVFFLVWPNV